MWTLAVDAVTAEIVGAFEEAGVDSLLLKGPSVAEWLYENRDERPYIDSDLLVDPDAVPAARATLRKSGFRQEFGPLGHPGMGHSPSYAWRRDGLIVDLHEALSGANADPRRTWAALRERSVELAIGGRPVRVLGESARLVLVALHAAHHGPGRAGPLEDLRRALDLAGDEDWAAAAGAAEEIGGVEAFTVGLSLLPAGRARLAALGLEARRSPERAAEWRNRPVVAGIQRLRAAHGAGARAAILRDELLPPAEFMRWWTPVARRRRGGLLAAYAWRWAYLLWHLPPALHALRRSAK